jgi:DNA repair protein RecN (Recombination protein N)
MLKRLLIKNFILVTSALIEFDHGLNIISGESGAGKTALIDALSLILGAKADSTLIREGCSSSWIEAAFEIDYPSELETLLQDAGIIYDSNEWLTIRRELSREGKNRCFINAQVVPYALLQTIGPFLIDLISQHSQTQLHHISNHRSLLDLFCRHTQTLLRFQQLWKKQIELQDQLSTLHLSRDAKEKEIDFARHVVEEIEEVNLKEGEDQALFEEYRQLSNELELTGILSTALNELTEAPNALLLRLNHCRQTCQRLGEVAPQLKASLALLDEAAIAVTEASHDFSKTLCTIENDSNQLDILQNRLSIIDRLKKKYGRSFEEIGLTKDEAQKKLHYFSTLEESIQQVEAQLKSIQEQANALCHQLHEKRVEGATVLSSLVTQRLVDLNMLGCEFSIRVSNRSRTQFGEDEITFWLKANVGEQWASVSSRSSGGELSRIMLAFKVILADLNQTKTILFDEIDANVGGETATTIGRTLKELGKSCQVLCITHFPQVARFADVHFQVKKQQENDRTLATMTRLNKLEKEKELLRMLGGTSAKTSLST